MPDLRHKRQEQRNASAKQIQYHQHGPARQAFSQRRSNRCHSNIGQHLDGQRRAKHCARIGPGQIKSQQAKGNGSQAGAQQGDDLRKKQMAISSVGEDFKHGLDLSR